jgi:hypothetical protein
LALLRERLPCSENFWRYRRNYEKLLDAEAEKDPSSPKPEKRNVNLASPKIMSKFSPTAGYINRSPGGTEHKGPVGAAAGILGKYAGVAGGDEDIPGETSEITGQIPITKFRSNNIAKVDRKKKNDEGLGDALEMDSSEGASIRLNNRTTVDKAEVETNSKRQQDILASPTSFLRGGGA